MADTKVISIRGAREKAGVEKWWKCRLNEAARRNRGMSSIWIYFPITTTGTKRETEKSVRKTARILLRSQRNIEICVSRGNAGILKCGGEVGGVKLFYEPFLIEPETEAT